MKNKSELLADRLNAEGELPCDDDLRLAEHPEGADRGGYLPTFTDDEGTVAYWDWCFYEGLGY